MSNLSDQIRTSATERLAEQQLRDRQLLELAAIVAWQTYAYETGTDADRRAMRVGWGLWPAGIFLWVVWGMVTNPAESGTWNALNLVLTGLCGLLGGVLIFVKPAPREVAVPQPAAAPQRFPDDEPFASDWRDIYPNQ